MKKIQASSKVQGVIYNILFAITVLWFVRVLAGCVFIALR